MEIFKLHYDNFKKYNIKIDQKNILHCYIII